VLGVDAADVLFAEPDLPQTFLSTKELNPGGSAFGLRPADCGVALPQHNDAPPAGPVDGWHLLDQFSQLKAARESVSFTAPRTRIAHIDTGYDPNHSARPAHILDELQHNFVNEDGTPKQRGGPEPPGRVRSVGTRHGDHRNPCRSKYRRCARSGNRSVAYRQLHGPVFRERGGVGLELRGSEQLRCDLDEHANVTAFANDPNSSGS